MADPDIPIIHDGLACIRCYASMESVYLAIDLGTSRLKAALITPNGSRVADYVRVVGGWRDPTMFMAACEDAIGALAAEASARRLCVRGIGLAVRMANLLLLDGDHQPLEEMAGGDRCGSQDAAEDLARDLAARGVDLHQRTGCPIDAHYPAPKLMAWWTGATPRQQAQLSYIGDLKDYLLWGLTRNWVTDPATASASQLWDQQTWKWLDLPALALPDSHPSIGLPWRVAGQLTTAVAGRVALPRLPVIIGTGDGPAMSIGAGILQRPESLLSLGTTTVLRWAEQGRRKLGPGEFRQVLSPRHRLRGRRLVGAAHGPAVASLCAGLRRAANGGVRALQVAGGGVSDIGWRAPVEQLGLPVHLTRCPDATLGTAVLIYMATGGRGMRRAVREMAGGCECHRPSLEGRQ